MSQPLPACLVVLWQIFSVIEDERLPVNNHNSVSWRLTLNFMVIENVMGESGGDQMVRMFIMSSPVFSLVDS